MTAIYKAGTATVTHGSTAVTGTDTAWLTALVTGGDFRKGGLGIGIAGVEAEDELTLVEPWPGPTGTGIYHIIATTAEAAKISNINDRLAQIVATGVAWGIPATMTGTLADRDALDLGVDDKQFVFCHFDEVESVPVVEFYRWSGTAWIGPFDPTGPAGATPLNAILSPDSSVVAALAMTQAEYDLLDPPPASTLIMIQEEE